MTVNITRTWGAEVEAFAPLLTSGYQTARQTLNIVHEILGGGIAVSHRGAQLRAGSLVLLFNDETQAAACLAAHAKPGVWAYTDTDRASVSMSYVVSGGINLELDDTSRAFWLVSVEYQEVE